MNEQRTINDQNKATECMAPTRLKVVGRILSANLQDPLLLTGTRDLYNYVDVVSGGLC